MRKLAVIVALVVSAGALARAQERTIRFDPQPEPNATFELACATSASIRLEADGLPPKMAPPQLAGKDVRIEMRYKFVLRTGVLAADGSLPFEVRTEDASVTTSVSEQLMPTPDLRGALMGIVFHGRIDHDGRWEVDGQDSGPSAVVQGALDLMVPPPKQELRVGDSFEIPRKFSLPGSGTVGVTEVQGTEKLTLREITGDEATFDTVAEWATTGKGRTEATKQMSVSATYRSRGTLVSGIVPSQFARRTEDVSGTSTGEVEIPREELEAAGERAPGDGQPSKRWVMKLTGLVRLSNESTMTRVKVSDPEK